MKSAGEHHSKRNVKQSAILAVALALSPAARAEVKLNSLFADNAVLQRGMEVPVWGTARDGEKITVEFAGQKVSVAAAGGKWMARLKPMRVSVTPRVMRITGDNTITLTNILVGDVWVASGQSNMERQLGPAAGQKPIVNWEAEAAAADYPLIRQYYVPKRIDYEPASDANGRWKVCSPESVKEFTAVGYFFARDVFKAEKAPIGILFSSVGGTVAEAWTSTEALRTMPDFQSDLDLVQRAAAEKKSGKSDYPERLARWYTDNDAGSAPNANWSAAVSFTDWGKTNQPSQFDEKFDGVIWFSKEIELPESWVGKEALLHLAEIDDADTTWVNGVKVGETDVWTTRRNYRIPAGGLKAGRNVITVRVLDTGGNGGFMGREGQLKLDTPGESPVPLAGEWHCREGCSLAKVPAPPQKPGESPNSPTVLYNAMIAPLQSFPIKGVVWYQGESNNGRTKQYQKLFPLLIADWRRVWQGGNFPFLFVQIAPYRDMSPEIREAQFLTLKKSPYTAMAVITDAGDADDIHPARKEVPGERLALAARALAYKEKLEFSGPLFKAMKIEGGKAVVSFTHTGGGLMAKDGELKGFTIAGADKKFVPAKAEIKGRTVVISSGEISSPTAVRYGWSNVPDVNLYNQEGLPASPFRSDVADY